MGIRILQIERNTLMHMYIWFVAAWWWWVGQFVWGIFRGVGKRQLVYSLKNIGVCVSEVTSADTKCL